MQPIDIDAEAGRFFDDSSLPVDGQPVLVLLLGGVGSGKTTIRLEQTRAGVRVRLVYRTKQKPKTCIY